MHKVYLTEEECSIIQGAQEIIDAFGGFPSMENGELINIEVKSHVNCPSRYDVSLLFDITGWISVCSFHANEESKHNRYPSIIDPSFTKIRLVFEMVENIAIDGVQMRACGEIKFTNKPYRNMVRQDEHPSTTPKIPRPFCGFGIRSGEQFFISFFEDEVKILSKFE